ncbi:hypothetical protein EUTSA_v10028015mg [Eutrema salsugineum]|uniref:Uncharacterized protein n=1 Tax=Eutrema salsugineum TaxID=72664 RepID=V4NK88_EUTSA|nr:hypothetical protein EUTSA_v10028015mg [Eutrema salsugineum]
MTIIRTNTQTKASCEPLTLEKNHKVLLKNTNLKKITLCKDSRQTNFSQGLDFDTKDSQSVYYNELIRIICHA